MEQVNLDTIRPMPGWCVCRVLEPNRHGRLIVDVATGKVTESVAEVLRVTPAKASNGGDLPPGFKAGDRIIIRDFLRYANPIGDLVGADKNERVFLLNNKDAFAVVSGAGTLGYYDEFVFE